MINSQKLKFLLKIEANRPLRNKFIFWVAGEDMRESDPGGQETGAGRQMSAKWKKNDKYDKASKLVVGRS